jgi:hypothetical protein
MEDLTEGSHRYYAAVTQMLENKPVLKVYAEAVLDALSEYTGSHYGLENVSVNIYSMEGPRPPARRGVEAILDQIRTEYEAARRGLSDVSQGTSQHVFITTKMENLGMLHEELQAVAGDNAMALIASALDQAEHTEVHGM